MLLVNPARQAVDNKHQTDFISKRTGGRDYAHGAPVSWRMPTWIKPLLQTHRLFSCLAGHISYVVYCSCGLSCRYLYRLCNSDIQYKVLSLYNC